MKKPTIHHIRRICLLLATSSGLALIGVATPVTLDPGSLSPVISSAYAGTHSNDGDNGVGGGNGGSGFGVAGFNGGSGSGGSGDNAVGGFGGGGNITSANAGQANSGANGQGLGNTSAALASKLGKLNAAHASATAKENAAAGSIVGLLADYERSIAASAAAVDEIDALSETITTFQSDIDDLQELIDAADPEDTDTIDTLQAEIDVIQIDLDDADEELAGLENALEDTAVDEAEALAEISNKTVDNEIVAAVNELLGNNPLDSDTPEE
jgi:hypothetical protein